MRRRVDDVPTLAKAACVGRKWRWTAYDERIWELICTGHYHRSPTQQRAVVSVLGGSAVLLEPTLAAAEAGFLFVFSAGYCFRHVASCLRRFRRPRWGIF